MHQSHNWRYSDSSLYDAVCTQCNYTDTSPQAKFLCGEERTMSCTLMESMLPPARAEDPITQKKVREINDKVVAAWCLDKQQFRSFRVENVIKMEQYNE